MTELVAVRYASFAPLCSIYWTQLFNVPPVCMCMANISRTGTGTNINPLSITMHNETSHIVSDSQNACGMRWKSNRKGPEARVGIARMVTTKGLLLRDIQPCLLGTSGMEDLQGPIPDK